MFTTNADLYNKKCLNAAFLHSYEKQVRDMLVAFGHVMQYRGHIAADFAT